MLKMSNRERRVSGQTVFEKWPLISSVYKSRKCLTLGSGHYRIFYPEARNSVAAQNHFFRRSLPRLRFMERSDSSSYVRLNSALAQRNAKSGKLKIYPNDDPRMGLAETLGSVETNVLMPK